MSLYKFIILLFWVLIEVLPAQTPKDYLSANFHKSKREFLRNKMPKNSLAVIFSNPVRNRSNDIDYVYHQDPNFYYLTGLREPHAVVFIYSDMQTDRKGNKYNEVLYLQAKNPQKELWNGKLLGVKKAKKELGFRVVKTSEEFMNSSINFKQFENIFIINFKNDYRNLVNTNTDLYDLIEKFKKEAGYTINTLFTKPKQKIYELIKSTSIENSASVAKVIGQEVTKYPDLKQDDIIKKYQKFKSNTSYKELQHKAKINLAKKSTINVEFLPTVLSQMREVKSKEELILLKKAIRISAIGQIEVMKAMRPNMSEKEIQGIHEFVYKKYGAEYEGYPSIVGAGNNGCVLHYTTNNKLKVDNDLVLMDLGAEYRGYTADVTRTIPANGKFSPEQKAIYELVLKAQTAGIKVSKAGNTFWKPGIEAKKVINQGLFELGIIKSPNSEHNYFPHGTSHYLGLDVHDAGTYNKLKPNTVITVEPGIYIPEGSPCDKKWWRIAVRIEDDILITDKEPINLSGEAPRTVDAIERMMKKESILNEWVLPNID